MVKRVLVTTSIELTWPGNEQPILFLGEWCKLHARKQVWQGLNAETVPYHWDDREKFQKDYIYLQRFYEEILAELTVTLNKLHNTSHSNRYWRIYIGVWLGYFIQVLFDRWSMLTKAITEYEIFEIPVIDSDECMFIPNDAIHFQNLNLSDEWNEIIYHSILKLMIAAPPIRYVPASPSTIPARHIKRSYSSSRIKRGLQKIINMASSWLSRSEESFFLSSYLPYKKAISLQIRMGQVPKFWSAVPSPLIDLQTERKYFDLPRTAGNEFENIVRELVPKFMPRVYLEGYEKVQQTITRLPWPINPSFIFTANSYSNDDVFKAWAAEKTETGSRLIVAQHGGYFGIGAFGFIEDHQLAIADTYISWGWDDQNQTNIVPFANLIIMNKSITWNPEGDILLVNMSITRYSYHLLAFPQSSQYLNYFEDQLSFVQHLSDEARKLLLVRPSNQDFGWDQRSRWAEREPTVRLDQNNEPFQKMLTGTRLLIASYNATTFLETLSLNIPTIIFWNPEHWELRPEAAMYFDQLERIGIFHRSPESAAAKVSAIYQHVKEWWQQPEIQDLRIQFCSKYSNSIEHPVRLLKTILNGKTSN